MIYCLWPTQCLISLVIIGYLQDTVKVWRGGERQKNGPEDRSVWNEDNYENHEVDHYVSVLPSSQSCVDIHILMKRKGGKMCFLAPPIHSSIIPLEDKCFFKMILQSPGALKLAWMIYNCEAEAVTWNNFYLWLTYTHPNRQKEISLHPNANLGRGMKARAQEGRIISWKVTDSDIFMQKSASGNFKFDAIGNIY